jgi:hypothetical protein
LAPGKNDTLIVRNVPCTILNRKNLNGRIYLTEVVQQAINEAQEKIKQKQLLSQACEHPEGSFVSPTTASHVVVAAYIKPNVRLKVEGEEGVFDVLFMDLEVLNTQEGKNLRALLEAGCSVGTSIRGLGDLEGDQVVEYDLLGVDIVGQPSSSTYTNMPIMESVKVESVNSKKLEENFIISTSSTNTVRDLAQAAEISSKLDNIGYGTVAKTSTKVDEETNPKTGATTTLVTLEAETSDEVSNLDQALIMAKKAMLNPLVHVDSVTIENVEEDGDKTKESVQVTEATPEVEDEEVKEEYEVILFAGDEFGRASEVLDCQRFASMEDAKKHAIDCTTNNDHARWSNIYKINKALNPTTNEYEDDYIAVAHVDKDGQVAVVEVVEDAYVSETAIKEAVEGKMDTKSRKFVLKTPNGYVAMNGNAINFVKKPSMALQFVEGKENSGIIHLDNIEKILDTMGIYDVEKYYKKDTKKTNSEKQETVLPENNILDGTPAKIIAGQPEVNMPVKEDANTQYVAIIYSNDGADQNTTPVTATELDSVIAEVSNLYQMKAKSLGPNIRMVVKNTQSGESYSFDPQAGQLTPMTEALNDDSTTEIADNKVTMKVDDEIAIEKEFDTPQQAKVVKAGIDTGKIDPTIMIKEEEIKHTKAYLVTDGFSLIYPYEGNAASIEGDEGMLYSFISLDEFEDNEDIKLVDYSWPSKEEAEKVVNDLNDISSEYNVNFEVKEIDLSMNEKLYKQPSEASDPFVDEPLSDSININEAGEDDSVDIIIRDIDWNIDSFGEEDPSEIIELLEKLPDEIKLTIHASDFTNSTNVKNAILAKAVEMKDLPSINDATIDLAGMVSMPKNDESNF